MIKTNWKKGFLIASLACLFLQMAGAVISISLAMPAQVIIDHSILSPNDASQAIVAKEFILSGTALAPPGTMMIVFALFLFIASRRGVLGVAGTILLSLQGILFTFATMGEHVNPDRFPLMPGPIYTMLLSLNQASLVAVSALGILTLVSKVVLLVRKRAQSLKK